MEQNALPIDIVLVRHGESEGNIAQQLSKLGDDALWTTEMKERHNSNYRLTDKGREQAKTAGKWVKENISETFDRYYCSEYTRAQETSALMNFPKAIWHSEFYLREQDRGILAGRSKQQRESEYSELVQKLAKDAFFLAPPGGESVASACLRVDRIIQIWKNACAGQRIISVCHGNIMLAFKVRLERLSQFQYKQIMADPTQRMYNTQVLHYTRRDPVTLEIAPEPRWRRTVVPWDMSKSPNTGWERLEFPGLTNEDLLAEVRLIPQLLNNEMVQSLEPRKKNKSAKQTKQTQTNTHTHTHNTNANTTPTHSKQPSHYKAASITLTKTSPKSSSHVSRVPSLNTVPLGLTLTLHENPAHEEDVTMSESTDLKQNEKFEKMEHPSPSNKNENNNNNNNANSNKNLTPPFTIVLSASTQAQDQEEGSNSAIDFTHAVNFTGPSQILLHHSQSNTIEEDEHLQSLTNS